MEELMTVESWSNPEVKARFYAGFVDVFTRPDIIQQNGTADIHKLGQENHPSC
jgi:hypothetical protein